MKKTNKPNSTYRNLPMDYLASQLVYQNPQLELSPKLCRYINRRMSQGRGTGYEAMYRPWDTVRDTKSKGYSTRIMGWKTNRIHHLMNLLQRQYFATLEWSPIVLDIREHYPLLPLELTLSIAQKCGVKHPINPRTGEPAILTTDFLLKTKSGRQVAEYARSVKYTSNLSRPYNIAKLEIERRYWEWRGIDWRIVTETGIQQDLAANVIFLHSYRELLDRPYLDSDMIMNLSRHLTRQVSSSREPLRHITSRADSQFGVNSGDSLAVVYNLIATKVWMINMNQPIDPGKHLVIENVSIYHETLTGKQIRSQVA
jgi:hypothetical protein